MKIHLIEIIDSLKSNWSVWECEVEDDEGNLKKASIESDGHMHAIETIEYYDNQ